MNFAKPEIADFVKARFDILQLNIIGAREVVDFDGEKTTEKRLAEKYGVRFTPTFQFFPERSAGLATRKPREREVARAQGYLLPEHFLSLFKFVSERAYEKGSLPDYLKANSPDLSPGAAGGCRLLEPPRYLLTGLSGLMSSATASLICSMVRILLVPKRGMLEHGNAAL